jgi:hypothetical protein
MSGGCACKGKLQTGLCVPLNKRQNIFQTLVLLALAPNVVIIAIVSLSWSLLSLCEPVQ